MNMDMNIYNGMNCCCNQNCDDDCCRPVICCPAGPQAVPGLNRADSCPAGGVTGANRSNRVLLVRPGLQAPTGATGTGVTGLTVPVQAQREQQEQE